jgi:hypothetical protein
MPKVSEAKPGKNKIKSNQQHPLQVRTSETVREALSEVAKREGRSLAKEIERRLEASVAAPKQAVPDALVYGWANPEEAKALGDALGMLAGRIEDNGPVPGDRELDRPDRLAMFKVAIVCVLDQLGASAKLSSEQLTFAELAARQFINDFRRVEPNPSAYSQRSDLAMMAWLKDALDTKTDGPNRKE